MKNLSIIIVSTLAGSIVGAGLMSPATASKVNHGTRQDHIAWAAKHLRPCPQEDSRNCYWDAGHSGNGIGQSFIDLNGKAYYLKRR